MILSFDLDDTLYPERTYVESGFQAVAEFLELRYGFSRGVSLEVMLKLLEQNGRGRVFDDLIQYWGHNPTKKRVNELVKAYREHCPNLQLPSESRKVLDYLKNTAVPLYLVTDGHKGVQAAKIDALGLSHWFSHAYITHRYGRAAAKPASHVFDLIIAKEKVSPQELVYVGDDPSKDFIGVRRLGGRTIRVSTGRLAHLEAMPGFEADITVPSLSSVLRVIERWRLAGF